ncbi:MAG: hypothetical protein NUV75_00580 [Gallionella sp.]|nr:hypothetical protein [Gallionella sp.]
MFAWFKHLFPITASAAGRLGNQVKRERARERYKRFHDEMRAAQGKRKWEWTK